MKDRYVLMTEQYADEYFNLRAMVKPEDKKEAFMFLFGGQEEKEVEKPPIYKIEGETAIIQIKGVLSQDGPDWIDRWLGIEGTAYKDIVAAAGEIKKNEAVKNVIFEINSPGGSVEGVLEASDTLKELSSAKKTTAINLNLMASGGYWLGSQANKIYASSPLAETGSIGVVSVLSDWQRDVKSDEYGYARVRIVSQNAKNKRPDITKPKERQWIQDIIDGIERTFISAIASGRGTTSENVIDNFGQGAMFIAHDPDPGAKDATKIGMIDGVIDYKSNDIEGNAQTISACIQPPTPPEKPEPKEAQNPAGVAGNNIFKEVSIMTPEELKAQHPHVYDAIFKAGKDAQKAETADIVAKASLYLKADSPYPASIKAMALDVVAGKTTVETMETTVKTFDALKEAGKSAATGQDQQPDVPGQQPQGVSADGVIANVADFNAEVKRTKQMLGQEV